MSKKRYYHIVVGGDGLSNQNFLRLNTKVYNFIYESSKTVEETRKLILKRCPHAIEKDISFFIPELKKIIN